MKRIKWLALAVSIGFSAYCNANDQLNEHGQEAESSKPENLMYAWFGDVDLHNPDFVAVINFDETSEDYGKLVTTSPLSGPNAFGNEAHHAGFIPQTNTLIVGGLLSVLRGQDDVFFFDTSNPLAPVFTRSFNVPQASTTDEFAALPNGNQMVTMMGSASGGAPGRVAEFDIHGTLVGEWPSTPPSDGFSPHGISIRPESNLMVTTDYVVPISTIDGPLNFEDQVRVWDLAKRQIVRTVKLPNAGSTMDMQLIPKDPKLRAIVPGQAGQLWLIDTQAGTAKAAFDFTTLPNQAQKSQPHIVKFTADGNRMFVSDYGRSVVYLLDSSNPGHIRLLDIIALGNNAGPHYMRLSKDERRLVVTDYFLNEHAADGDYNGLVQLDGDRKIHVIKVDRDQDKLSLDKRFQFDGNTAFSTGAARPHAVIFNTTDYWPHQLPRTAATHHH
jgi:56kDa selenium binding protein (SBP56)